MIFVIFLIVLLIICYCNINLYKSLNSRENYINLENIPFDVQSYSNCHIGSYKNQNYRWYNPSKDLSKDDCYNIAKTYNITWLGEKKSLNLPFGCLLGNNYQLGSGIIYNKERSNIDCGVFHNEWGKMNCLCGKRSVNI